MSTLPGKKAASARITLIGRAGCHLCEVAQEVVEQVAAQTGASWEAVDIDSDADLLAAYAEQIPVILVDGRQHSYWRVDAERLREALQGRRRWWLRGPG